MGILFDDPLYERFATRALSHALYGGADFGECIVTAKQITPADPGSWHRAWTATADRVFEIAQECAASGQPVSAREAISSVSGRICGNTLVADVPLNGFGSPVTGALLYNVTAFSGSRNADNDIYSDVDATRTFDYVLGSSSGGSSC